MENERKVFEVKWKIKNLLSWLQTREDTLYSHQFLAEPLENTRWKLRLSPEWHLGEKYASLALQRDVEDDHPDSIDLNYELSCMASEERPLKSKARTKRFEPKTVSDELNVKEKEISINANGYIIVCCKMWKIGPSTSKAGRCFIQSVIGTKSITMDGSINASPGHQTVSFASTSEDISLISIDVYIDYDVPSPDTMTFDRKEIRCKRFSFYYCELFLYSSLRKPKPYLRNWHLNHLLDPNKNVSFPGHNWCNIIRHTNFDVLTVRLQITYSPAVESNTIEYEWDGCRKQSSSDQGMENVLNSENATSNHLKTPEDEEECNDGEEDDFDTSGTGRVLSNALKKDLASLHNDQLFCDTELRTETETFPAHRCVLSARSPVFKKMFTTDMKEKAGEGINLPDISSDTLRRMLQFLYTDSIGDLDMQSAKDLYIASDKYDISSLRKLCSSFMKKNLCPPNVCEVLVLADMHQDKDLESGAQEYILTNEVEVFDSDEWRLFMKNHGSLAAQVMYSKCVKN